MLKNIDQETMFTFDYRIEQIDTILIHLFVLNSILSMLETSQPDLHCCLHFPNFLSHLSRHCLLSLRGRERQLFWQLSLWALHPRLQALADTVDIITRPRTNRTIRNLVFMLTRWLFHLKCQTLGITLNASLTFYSYVILLIFM